MKNVDVQLTEPTCQELIEGSWRRPLSRDEDTRLRRELLADPHARAEAELDAPLTQCLQRLPSVRVSTNFTALVMQAVQRPPPKPAWQSWLDSWLPIGLLPRLATGAAMVCLSLFSIHEYQDIQRERTARDLATVAPLANVPKIEWLQNFDTISRLNRIKVADDDLLATLQ